MKKIKHRSMLIVLFLLAGVLAGMLLPEILRMNSGTYAGFFSFYSFHIFEQQTIRYREIFMYLAVGRMELLLFLWMSSFTPAGRVFHLIYAGWLSISAGMLLSLFILKCGYYGIPFFLCCLMPQWIIYGLMWKREAGIHLTLQPAFSRPQKLSWLTDLCSLILLCTAGCLCETWIGIRMIKKVFRIFL